MAHAWQHALVAALGATPGALPGRASAPTWRRTGGSGPTAIWSLSMSPARFLVKIADPAHAEMLSAEAEGLRALAGAGAIRVPAVHANGTAEDAAFLALEWLDIVDGGRGAALGHALAKLHRASAPRFGWHRDNTIGATPQRNDWSDDWAAFFRDCRLAPQLELAAANGYGRRLGAKGECLLAVTAPLLDGHEPAPSLLHGDLWAGNAGRLDDDTPVVFDPATYYGDREADLAMTELFGGFPASFLDAYAAAWPLAPGYPLRRTLYNLYHVLNHLNLFGASYLARVEAMMDELLAAAV